MIIVGKYIEDISLNDLEYLLDDDGSVMKFKSKEHAIAYLKRKGFDNEDIYFLRFIYTNENKECNCYLCERKSDCYIADKFQRLPRESTRGLGLGLCPKLKEVYPQ